MDKKELDQFALDMQNLMRVTVQMEIEVKDRELPADESWGTGKFKDVETETLAVIAGILREKCEELEEKFNEEYANLVIHVEV